jgi:hypothetical protein
MEVLNKTLNWSYNQEVYGTYIIRVKDHELSEKLAARCLESCQKVGQKAELYDAFDGTDPSVDGVKVPKHCQDATWLKWLKLINYHLTKPEICCTLSHFSLWCKCIELDRPIAILEHDAVMLNQFTHHPVQNCIVYLGCIEQYQSQQVNMIPPHAQLHKDYRHLLRTHAYSVDPLMAKNLVSYVIERGITSSADVTMSLNRFAMTCFGLFAMDIPGPTTIPEWGKDK